MFYCNDCGDKRDWPRTLAKCYGSCEICGKIEVCNDHPSRKLSIPKRTERIQTINKGEKLCKT